jgi:ferric-dicitrate binding protein FerR (iron transport regulator)
MMHDEATEALMVKVVDGVATPAEREALMRLATQDPELRRELERHQALKALTDGWVERLEHDLAQDTFAASKAHQSIQTLGILIATLGLAILTGGGIYEGLVDPEAPTWLRLGLALWGGGGVMLIVYAIYWRVTTYASDPYTEIIR